MTYIIKTTAHPTGMKHYINRDCYIDATHPAAAIAKLTAVLDRYGYTVDSVRAYCDIADGDGSHILQASRDIARAVTHAATRRDATSKAWERRRYADANDWSNPAAADVQDMASVASVTLWESVRPLHGSEILAPVSALLDACRAWQRADRRAPREQVDVNKARRAAVHAAAVLRARQSGDIADAYAAAYIAVNHHITDARRDMDSAPLSLDDILSHAAPTTPDSDIYIDATRRRALTAAAHAVADTLRALTPARRRIMRYMLRGYSVADITRAMHYADGSGTAAEHVARIRRACYEAMIANGADALGNAYGLTVEAADAPSTSEDAARKLDRDARRAVAIATARTADAAAYAALTPRRRECLDMYLDGKTERDIAAALGIAQPVVHRHIVAARRALNI